MHLATFCTAFALATLLGVRVHAQEVARDESPRPSRPNAVLTFEGAGGVTERWILGRAFTMATVEGGLTVLPRASVAVPITFEYSNGATPYGLRASLGRLTCSAEGLLGRVRLGGGVGPSYLVIGRATNDDPIRRLGASVHLHAALEIVRWGEASSVFVRPRAEVDYFWGGEHAVSGTLSLGARL